MVIQGGVEIFGYIYITVLQYILWKYVNKFDTNLMNKKCPDNFLKTTITSVLVF